MECLLCHGTETDEGAFPASGNDAVRAGPSGPGKSGHMRRKHSGTWRTGRGSGEELILYSNQTVKDAQTKKGEEVQVQATE